MNTPGLQILTMEFSLDGHEEWRVAVVEDGQLVATASVVNHKSPVVTVYQLYVKPAWRGKGIGSDVVESVEKMASPRPVSAVIEHGGPIGFWASLGYKPVHFENGRTVVSKG